MKKLTLKYALDNKLSAIECVKYFNPEITDVDADYIVWEETCYPFSNEQMIEQLNNKFLNGETLRE